MMDSYNLSWKLIHSLHGLTPQADGGGDNVLDTFQTERLTVAQQLIAFDKEFSSMFSGKIGSEGDNEGGLTHEQFLEVFSTGNGFTSGCGIEYPENLLVERMVSDGLIEGTDYLSGVLRPGRRLLNVKAKRHADGYKRDLQDGEKLAILKLSSYADISDRLPLHRPFPYPLSHVYRSSHTLRHLLHNLKLHLEDLVSVPWRHS